MEKPETDEKTKPTRAPGIEPARPKVDQRYLKYLQDERKYKRSGLLGRTKKKIKKLFSRKKEEKLPTDSFGYSAVYGTQHVVNPQTGVSRGRGIHGPVTFDQFYPTWSSVGREHLKPVPSGKPLIEKHMNYMEKKFGIKFICRLGSGKSGPVWKVRVRYWREYKNEEPMENVVMACKVLSMKKFDESHQRMVSVEQAVENMLNELRTVRKLKHPNIVRIRKCVELPDTKTGFPYSAICMLMEYCDGSLDQLMQMSRLYGRLLESECWVWFKQIAEGLRYLHQNGITHLNIKPQNILFVVKESGNKLFKLCDFYYAMTSSFSSKFRVDNYMAPEVRREGPAITQFDTMPADIWSLCLTLIVALMGLEANPQIMLDDLRYREWPNIQYIPYPPSAELADLMIRMTEINPNDRPTIEEEITSRLLLRKKKRALAL